jgi:ParB-like chromosome segregation protein Spo0J
MEIEHLSVSSLKLDPNNARTHDNANLEAIAGSLAKFGQRKPIVVTHDDTVVAGNGTLTAALSLGWKEISAVRIPKDWDEAQIKAFALADNRTAELADWNSILLAEQLVELETLDFDISAIGFEQVEEKPQKELEEFPTFSDETETAYKCPKCSYEWNGAPR